MGKREKTRRMKDEGLHEIKNKYRVRAVNKKRKGLVFTAKKRRRVLKACASLSAIFILLLGVFSIGSALLSSVVPNVVPDDFVTVSYELPDDGSKPDSHSALENIGYMNYRFKNQPSWYAEMHGTTVSMGLGQSVNTIKQYSDGVLILSDVTSGFKNIRRQFCYVGNEVMWRESSGGSCKMDSYEDMLALTYPDELEAHMTIPAFKSKNGLPGTEFTVYVINEETLDHASEVELVSSADWDGVDNVEKPVYKQTYYLRPGDTEDLGAAAHYMNQMAFTGGLVGLPTFNYITVTYTFDSSWQVLRAEINESYEANVGIPVSCTSDYTTNYEYGTDRAKNDVYENYFKDFVGKGIDDNVEKPLDALGMITSAFLAKPVTFGLELEINNKATEGVIALDASKLDIAKITGGGSIDIGAALGCIGLKARIGDIYLYLEDSSAYLSVGGLKAKLPIDKLLGLIGGGTAETARQADEKAPADGEQAPVFEMGDPVLEERDGKTYATVNAKLNLTSLGVDLIIPLDFEFSLDEEKNASLESLDLRLTYQGIDAKVAIKSTDKSIPELSDRDSYIDLYPYAEAVYDLIAGKKLAIGLNYQNADMALSGNIGIDFTSGLTVAGELTLGVRSQQKTVAFAVKDGVAYVNLDGIRLAVSVKDAAELIKGFLPVSASADAGSLKAVLDQVLTAVFENDLASLVSLGEEENVLSLGVKGTELLELFGVNFELGDVNLRIDGKSGAILASAYGAELSVQTLDKELSIDTNGYTELMPYAEAIFNLLKNKSLTAKISYENANVGGEMLTVNGDIVIGLSPLEVSGRIAVSYGALKKSAEFVYGRDGYLYLVLDALKVKVNVNDAVALFSSLLAENGGQQADIYETLEKVLAVDFGELISIFETETEAGNVLNAAVDGSRLLNLFGVNFDLGEVVLTVGSDRISASALGIGVSVTGGGEVKTLTEAEAAKYVDLFPVLEGLPEILNCKALTINGKVVLTAGGTDYLLKMNRGVLSFRNGFEAYLDLTLVTTSATLDLQVSIDTEGVRVALGGFGAELAFSDLPSLGDAVVALYAEVRETLNPVSEKELLPEAKTIGDLFNLLSALFAENGTNRDMDLGGLLAGLSIENSEEANGLFAVKFAGLTLDVVKEDVGFIGAKVRFENKDLQVTGGFSASAYAEETPSMPDVGYLNGNDFIELLDYLVAALNTLSESELNFKVTGAIGTEVSERYPDGVKYNLSGDIRLYSGENTAIHLDLDKKGLWIDTDTYLYAKIDLDPVFEEDKGIYLEFFLVDCDENGAADGEILDVFVSVSLRKKSTASAPLTLYAPANEIMPVISSALALLGVDNGIVADYIVSPWISSLETRAQLRGFGKSIFEMIGGFADSSVNAGSNAKAPLNIGSLVSSVKVGERAFELALSSEAIFGTAGDPLTVAIEKEKTEKGSRLTRLSVSNIAGTSVSVGVSYGAEEKIMPSFKGMIPMNGIASLLQTISRSVTHRADGDVISGEETKHDYILNQNFYIDGGIKLNVNAIGIIKVNLDIKVVAFSITLDSTGVWGVNVRFEYDALKMGVTAINGNTQVDLTGKDNMVYIKRVQTTDADGKGIKPIVLYRAMPLKNFVGDLIGQAGFLFNLGSTITDLLKGIDMSGSGNTAEETDLGATVGNILTSIDYTKTAEAGESWKITLNGAGLTGGVLGDIVVTLGSDKNGLLRTLTAHTSLSTTGISMTLDADLAYRNPCGVMDAGVKDITEDIATILIDGMSHKLQTVDWTETTFIEGEFTSIDYVLMGKVIYTQEIVISTGNGGDAKGTVYGALNYPDLSKYDTEKGYKAEWVVYYGQDDPLPDSKQIFAQYNPKTYQLTFELGGERISLDYLYGDADFELPFRANETLRIAYFTDEEGGVYRTADDLMNLAGDAVLTAVYEDVVYTVTFVVGDERIEQKALYGEAVNYPAAHERTGYTFSGWDSSAEKVTCDMTVNALWTANEYTVTFISAYEIDGYDWTANADGGFAASFVFTYDSKVALPRDERRTVGDKTFVLRGFCFEEGGECFLEYLPNVTANTTFVAEWQELGFDLTFVFRDGSRTVLNYHGGDTVAYSMLPKIEAIDGYTSFWLDGKGNRVTGDYRVTGEEEFTVSDVANVYTVTLVSDRAYAGFTAADGAYIKTLSYTYGGQAVVPEALGDIRGYWFKGYYTEENGKGDRVDSLDRILQDTTLYVYWQDNTVVINVCSDVQFAGSVQDNRRNGYVKQYTFNDSYDLGDSVMPKVAGYQTLALWHKTESGWERVTNVRDLNGADLWVLWIKNIQVTVTNYSGNKTYTIKGYAEGGSVYGNKSNEIFTAVGGTVVTVGQYSIMSADGKNRDNLQYNKEVAIDSETGEFGDEGMLSLNGLGWDAAYGGILITKKFSYTLPNGASETISTSNASYVSKATYTVTYVDKYGVTTKIDGVRVDYPYDDYDSATYVDELAEKNGIAAPDKDGYSGSWKHVPVTGSMTAEPVFTANRYLVRFESAQAIANWTEENGKYIYETYMNYEAKIAFYVESTDKPLVSYTVGMKDNVFTVPVLPDMQKWGDTEISERGFAWYAQYNVDTVIYNSEVSFTYGGVVYDSFLQEVGEGYEMIAPTAEGYTFLGWYRLNNGNWERISSISLTEGEEKVTTTVQALWVSDLKVEITEWNRAGLVNPTHTATAKVSGGNLVGAFAKEAEATLSVRYYVNNNTNYESGTSHGVKEFTEYGGEEREASFSYKSKKKDYAHIVASVTLTCDKAGFALTVGEENGHVYKGF